jgi:hypothetical protein
MSQLPILRILPFLALAMPLAALANQVSSILPMTLGQGYTGSLTPSPENPQGEVCYKLAVKPDTRITLKVKTAGVGILKFAVYDKTKALRFFHNDVSNKPTEDDADSKFSFPASGDISQLCLTTTNPDQGQQYDLTVTGEPLRKSKSSLAVRPVAATPVPIPPPPTIIVPSTSVPIPPPPPPVAPTTDLPTVKPPIEIAVETPPPPRAVSPPYCYVGIWQISDLNAYWLPTIQNFTQAQITAPQMLGYGKVTLTKDGDATFEAFDLIQKYTLVTKETGAKIDKIELNLGGAITARFQVNPDSSLTFSSQNERRLTTTVKLGDGLKLTGDRLFKLFGDAPVARVAPQKLPYRCIDRDNLTLRIPAPTGQKLIPISLKRVN